VSVVGLRDSLDRALMVRVMIFPRVRKRSEVGFLIKWMSSHVDSLVVLT